jgi:hypothetical protein
VPVPEEWKSPLKTPIPHLLILHPYGYRKEVRDATYDGQPQPKTFAAMMVYPVEPFKNLLVFRRRKPLARITLDEVCNLLVNLELEDRRLPYPNQGPIDFTRLYDYWTDSYIHVRYKGKNYRFDTKEAVE